MTRMFIGAALLAASFSAHAASVSLNAAPAAASANLTWTVSNGTVNAQEVYRDTDSNPSGRVRVATLTAGARSYTATGLTNGVQYYFWIKARQSSDNLWINSNAAGVIPMAGSGGNTYHWPLTGNLGTHDPTLINENGTWWEFQTGAGIYGKVSRNGGLQWDPLPSVLPNGLSWWRTYVPNQSGNDVWAPDVKVHNGRTWMYYSVSTFGSKVSLIGLISASSIAAGDWRDDGLVIRTTASN